ETSHHSSTSRTTTIQHTATTNPPRPNKTLHQSQAGSLTTGRWPNPGEAIVSVATAAAYGLDGPQVGLRSLIVVATTAETAGTTQAQVLQLIAASNPQDLRVTSPATLAEVQQAVGADLTTFSRSLLALEIGRAHV